MSPSNGLTGLRLERDGGKRGEGGCHTAAYQAPGRRFMSVPAELRYSTACVLPSPSPTPVFIAYRWCCCWHHYVIRDANNTVEGPDASAFCQHPTLASNWPVSHETMTVSVRQKHTVSGQINMVILTIMRLYSDTRVMATGTPM